MNPNRPATLVIILLGACAAANAQQGSDKLAPGARLTAAATPRESMPRESLEDILSVVSDRSKKRFVVEARVPPRIVVGQVRVRDITYPILLTILANNGLAAVTIGDVISIVPVATVRQYPLPVLTSADDSVDSMAWITWTVQVQHIPAVQLVPILRPLLPAAGHLAANQSSNSILIVDRYGNVQRVMKIIQRLDTEFRQSTE
jgi:general secretion pathway protein D